MDSKTLIIVIIVIVVLLLLLWWLLSSSKPGPSNQVNLATNLNGSIGLIPANGKGQFTYNPNTKTLNYQVTLVGPTTNDVGEAHIYDSTGIVKDIVFTNTTINGTPAIISTGTWTSTDQTQPLTPDLIGKLLSGQLSVRITPTIGNPINGQITPLLK